MTAQGGTASQLLSLPTGGGAVHGIGEKFSADPHTGTAGFSIPLALPAGRNGFQPSLTLAYSTGLGNGPFGLGWNLDLPRVSRKTSRGRPRYVDDQDTFILSGAEDLVAQPRVAGGPTVYRPRTEGLFAQIEHHVSQADDYWLVRTGDGLTSWYGTVGSRGADPATLADPHDRSRVFSWCLSRTTDPFGNRIEYAYHREPGDGWEQVYLQAVRYADSGDPDNPEFLVSVRPVYDLRLDHVSDFRAGFEIRTTLRCTRIEIATHAGAETITRTYHLDYLDQLAASAADLPPNGTSLLSRVRVEGHAGTASEWLPSIELGYTRFEPSRRGLVSVSGPDLPTGSLGRGEYELVDLSGNGLPDVVEMNGSVRYWRNLGNGQFDWSREMPDAPAGVSLAQAGVQLLDANGDGRLDLLLSTELQAGYYPLRFDGTWDRNSFQPYPSAPSFEFDDPEVRLLDLDGDGVTDAVRSGSRLECFFQDPRRGWSVTRLVERRALDEFPNVTFSDPRVKVADLTGDGLQDIALVSGGSVVYWPNLGRGDWGARICMRNSPRLPDGYDPRRVLLGDLDGDGLSDLLYVEDTQVTLWINRSGKSWSEPITIKGTPAMSDMDSAQVLDLLGSGVAGVLWSRSVGAQPSASGFFLDVTGGTKPYLLSTIDNNLGALTQITYAPSTRFYLEDELTGETRWRTPLPFPVQVVWRVQTVDAISHGTLSTEYRYHHGYWDGAEREFRGFGMVEQFDTEQIAGQSFLPPTLTRTWFDLGPVGDEVGDWAPVDFRSGYWPEDPGVLPPPPHRESLLKGLSRRSRRDALRALRGRVLRSEVYGLDGSAYQNRPYTVTESTHGVAEVVDGGAQQQLVFDAAAGPDPAAGRVFVAYTVATRTTQWERGNDPLTHVVLMDDLDSFGRPRRQTSVALPRCSARREPVVGAVVGSSMPDEVRILATHTWTEYAQPDPGTFLHDHVAHARTFELDAPPTVSESAPNDLRQVLRDQVAAALDVRATFCQALSAWQAGQPVPSALRLVGHTINHYDGTAFAGRPPGEVGPYGALTLTETLAFTSAELDTGYAERRPAYLGGNQQLPLGAPAGFGSGLGYRLEAAAADGHHAGYYIDAERRQLDVQDARFDGDPSHRRGMLVARCDALGHLTSISPDTYWLLPERTVDGLGLEVRVAYEYARFQPAEVTDVNGHTTCVRYSPLGLVRAVFLRSRDGLGGSEVQPETEYEYDLLAYQRTRSTDQPQPAYAHQRQRLHHASDQLSDETIESREYSDGFGRLIQKRAQAEALVFGPSGDDPGLPPEAGAAPGAAVATLDPQRVVVSGWQVFDTKGRPVEQYQPFFSTGWAFQAETEARRGRYSRLYYDPRGHVVRTVSPDGSEQRRVIGSPRALDQPEAFDPSPWLTFTYDQNDLAGLSVDADLGVSLAGRAPPMHHNTPASMLIDALGRPICHVERNGPVAATDWFVRTSRYDLRGNLLRTTDGLGRVASSSAFDLLNRSISATTLDGGRRTSVFDAVDGLVEYRDSQGNVALSEYDGAHRHVRLWATQDSTSAVRLCERLVYGDEGDRGIARTQNLLGRLATHYDDAGVQRFERYDFKGNLEERVRQVVSDSALGSGWRADWSAGGADAALDPWLYRQSSQFDALNRVIRLQLPAEISGHRALLEPRYSRSGALEAVTLDGAEYISCVAYNSKGQRLLITYGNGVMTRYAHDARTSRLRRVRSERFQVTTSPAGTRTWVGQGPPLQDAAYEYDLVGNLTALDEQTPGCGIAGAQFGRDRLERQFAYDPVYRLTQADGRECGDIATPRPIVDALRCGAYVAGVPTPSQANAPDLTEAYVERYAYDPAGNQLSLRHTSSSASWMRAYGFGGVPADQWPTAPNNRLTSLTQGGITQVLQYDGDGSLVAQNGERTYAWDHAGRLIGFVVRPSGSAHPSIEARYLYGSDGQRVKKWVRRGAAAAAASTTYIEGTFEHMVDSLAGVANNYVHILDGRQRVALVRRGPAHPSDAGPAEQYHLADHLGSCVLVTDATANWLNREEYFPYGETSFGSFARKRYRFMAKERDEESGLCAHPARYYAPWLGRWTSCDPGGTVDGFNLYVYAHSNPMRYVDPQGTQVRPANADELIALQEQLRNTKISLVASPTADQVKEFALRDSNGPVLSAAGPGPPDPRNEIRKWNMSESPVIPYDGYLASANQVRQAEASEAQMQLLSDLAASPLACIGFLSSRDPEEARRRARLGAVVWDMAGAHANALEMRANLREQTAPTRPRNEVVDQPADAPVEVKTTNARLGGLAKVAESGQVRWVAGDLQLFKAYESYMGARRSTAGGRYGFNLTRSGIKRRTDVFGPLHHFRYPLSEFPGEALKSTNLYDTGSFQLHLDLHRAMGVTGAPYNEMMWGLQPEIQSMFNFWLNAPPKPP